MTLAVVLSKSTCHCENSCCAHSSVRTPYFSLLLRPSSQTFNKLQFRPCE
jgi:hypothetical protein